jgi:hypothetical protein
MSKVDCYKLHSSWKEQIRLLHNFIHPRKNNLGI